MKTLQNSIVRLSFAIVLTLILVLPALPVSTGENERYWVSVRATTREDRTQISEMGFAIEEVGRSAVGGTCDYETILRLKKKGFSVIKESPVDFMLQAFPPADADYHDYSETTEDLRSLAASNPNLISFFTAGSSVQGKSIIAIRFNNTEKGMARSEKPGIIFMGTHHAREHLSTEIPLMLAKYLSANYHRDPDLRALMDSRDIFIIPMVNPDGVEYDISCNDEGKTASHCEGTRNYLMWRKNMRDNGGGIFGVDLNRNYGYKWGTGGSSSYPGSDTYKGPSPFSEPETSTIKNLVDAHSNIRILLTFHTFSELILYPWGHKYDSISDSRDLAVFEKMARTMAQWNGYTPEQSSDLYIASGDTTDWAYGEHKIFAFTFELTPRSMGQGGFYPGPRVIQSTFNANLKPCLYLIGVAGNPYGVLGTN